MATQTSKKSDPSIKEGLGETLAPALIDISELNPAELMAFPPPPKPSWPETRFPVSKAEFEKLSKEAAKPTPPSSMPEEAACADTNVDSDQEVELTDYPEDYGSGAPDMALAPPTINNFPGIPDTGMTPPDNTIATGPDHIMLSVNSRLAIYSKAGALLSTRTLANFFAPVLPAGASFVFDPKLAYDHYQNRWIVVAVCRRNVPQGSWIMLGVSQTANPLGAYSVWATNAMLDGGSPSNNWADYPNLGFDTQCIYITTNQFAFGGGFAYSKLRIFHKPQVYAGGAIQWFDYWGFANPGGGVSFTLQPCVHFRGLGGTPPAYFINAIWPGANRLVKWTLTNPARFWIGGPASTWTANNIACLPYDLPPAADQPGSAVNINTNDSRLLNAIFQHVGGTQRIWTCQTSRHTWPGEAVSRSIVQWYEIDVPTNAVVQQGRYGASGLYYYFPAIQTDLRRNAFLVFGRSGANEFASLRQTGRLVAAPLGTMQGSALVRGGTGAYTEGRWGDYFGICRDPADTMRVWMYGEYATSNVGVWGTQVASVRF